MTFTVSLSASDSKMEDEGGIERHQRESPNATIEGRQTRQTTTHALESFVSSGQSWLILSWTRRVRTVTGSSFLDEEVVHEESEH